MSRVQPLYRLQNIDSHLDEIKQYLVKITANLGRNKTLIKAEKIVAEAEQAWQQAQIKMKDLDLEVKGMTTKIANNEKRLYSGKAVSAKEAASLQEEVVSLKRWNEKREELLLEVMVATDEAEKCLNEARANLAAIKEKWASDQEKLHRVQTQLEQKVSYLTEQRPSILQNSSPEDLAEYEKLRTNKAGRAVAEVVLLPEIQADEEHGGGYVCQACNVGVSYRKVQQARTGTELVYCGTCGRILYVT